MKKRGKIKGKLGGKLGEKFRKFKKKKSFWIISAIVLLVLIGAGVFTFFQVKRAKAKTSMTTTVQSATAEKGSIATTVTGTGNLETGDTVDVSVPVGVTIDKIKVSSGDTVKKGTVLATVDEASVANTLIEVKEDISTVNDEIDALSDDADDSSTTEYLKKIVLQDELANLKAARKSLKKMLKSGEIVATSAGTVSTISVSEGAEVTKSTTTSNSSTSSGSSDSSSSTSGSGLTTQSTSKTSNVTFTTLATTSTTAATSTAASTTTAGKSTSSDTNTDSNSNTDTTLKTASTATVISKVNNLSVEAPVTGNVPQSSIASTDQYTGTITWDCSEAHFGGDTVYRATILLTAKSGYTFSDDVVASLSNATLGYKVVGSGEGNSLRIIAAFEKTAAETSSSTGSTSDSSGSSGGSTSGSTSGSGSSGTGNSTGNAASGNAASGSSASGASGGSGSASSGSSSSGSASSSSSSSSSSSDTTEISATETTGFTIATGDTVDLSISVDELDILSVEKGQSVTVTLDAVENQEYTGTISSVSNSGTTSSGSTKYTAVVSINKDDNMLVGMSASATINIDEATDAILIPVSALQEGKGSSYVYTSKDSDGNLSGKVEVETGLSNDSQVEITSGLSEGDTVYYTRISSSDSSENADDMMKGMGGGMNGGQMPSGEAPSGSGGGNGMKQGNQN